MTRRAMGVKAAAAEYDVSEDTLRGAINRRELRAKKSGRKVLIDTDALDEWFNALPDASPEADAS